MKQKIHILINEEARRLGLYYGFWNWFFLFQKNLKDLEIEVNFFSSIKKNFFQADHLFLNSRSFPEVDGHVNLEYIQEIYKKNKNLYWFDMRDSAGTTQFEVLPFVKKYVKKQLYKDKKIYFNKIKGGRFHTDYYINTHTIKDFKDYNQELLNPKYLKKLTLGWNLGVAFFFDYVEFSKIDYYLEFLKFKYLDKMEYKMKLPFYENWNEDKIKYDYFSLMNTKFYRESVGFQRIKLKKVLENLKNKNGIIKGRFNKKKYYETLRNSKVSIGAFGWGEICYREFEAIMCGTAFMTADMSKIETWPNIYHDGHTYLSYDLEFENLENNLNILINDISLRKKLVINSKSILENCHLQTGKKYFLNKILEIIE